MSHLHVLMTIQLKNTKALHISQRGVKALIKHSLWVTISLINETRRQLSTYILICYIVIIWHKVINQRLIFELIWKPRLCYRWPLSNICFEVKMKMQVKITNCHTFYKGKNHILPLSSPYNSYETSSSVMKFQHRS